MKREHEVVEGGFKNTTTALFLKTIAETELLLTMTSARIPAIGANSFTINMKLDISHRSCRRSSELRAYVRYSKSHLLLAIL